MDQISPPFRIAIVALLAVGALWFTVLKPKAPADDAPLPAAPGTTGLAHDVNAAKGAVATSDAANKATEAATGGTSASTPSATATAKPAGKAATATAKGTAKAAGKKAAPAAKTTDPSAPLLSALNSRHAVVLLFWNRKATDDRAVRRAVAATARRHGKVLVKIVPVSKVARYGAITRGAQVLQSPTTLVIAPGKKARPIVGLTTTAEIDQAVGDALAGK